MILTSLNRVLPSCVLLLLLSAASGVNASEPSYSQKRQAVKLVDNLKSATKQKDLNTVMSFIDKDVSVFKEYLGAAPALDYEQYQQALSKQFRKMSNYQYQRSNEAFKIAENGTDLVLTLSLREMYFVKNQYKKVKKSQSWWIKSTDSGPKLYKLVIH